MNRLQSTSPLSAEETGVVADVKREMLRLLDDPAIADPYPASPHLTERERLFRAIMRQMYQDWSDERGRADQGAPQLSRGWLANLLAWGFLPESKYGRSSEDKKRLVKGIVGRTVRLQPDFDHDDILQEASVAAMRAMQTYDPSRGPLEAWLRWRIRSRVLDWLRSRSTFGVRRNRELQEIDTAFASLEQSLQRRPSDEELATFMDRSAEWLQKVRDEISVRETVSLEQLGQQADFASREPQPFDDVWKRESLQQVMMRLHRLSAAELQILDIIYLEGQSENEAARRLGIPRSSVQRMHKVAISSLRLGKSGASAQTEDAPVSTAALIALRERFAGMRQSLLRVAADVLTAFLARRRANVMTAGF